MNTKSKTTVNNKAGHMKKIPLDTMGHPLPPPVRAEQICRIPRRDWGKWWTQYFDDTLESELDCSVCGLSSPISTLIPLDRATVEIGIQRRVLNTSCNNVRLCKSCKAVCNVCGRTTLSEHKKKYNGVCQTCIEDKEITQRKRKSPSGC
jgi:hypothetical protein